MKGNSKLHNLHESTPTQERVRTVNFMTQHPSFDLYQNGREIRHNEYIL